MFIKFCSYFPFNAKLCINGHEYLKRLARCGIAFEALDNHSQDVATAITNPTKVESRRGAPAVGEGSSCCRRLSHKPVPQSSP